jgi:uncharacterized membrane protein YkvI
MVPQWLTRVMLLLLVVVASISASGCEAIGDIFKAGVWVGVVFIVIIIAIVGFIAAKIRG